MKNLSRVLSNKNWKKIIKITLIVIGSVLLLTLCWHALADGTDILAGTNGDANTTLSNTGKKWLYLIEGIGALYAYHKSKNVFVLGSIVVVAIFINIVLHFAGA